MPGDTERPKICHSKRGIVRMKKLGCDIERLCGLHLSSDRKTLGRMHSSLARLPQMTKKEPKRPAQSSCFRLNKGKKKGKKEEERQEKKRMSTEGTETAKRKKLEKLLS